MQLIEGIFNRNRVMKLAWSKHRHTEMQREEQNENAADLPESSVTFEVQF